MMTSWKETEQIEAYLTGTVDTGDALVFEAQMILNPVLADKTLWQQKTYAIIRDYGRRQLKKEIEQVHQQLFTQPAHRSFSEKIRLLFSKQ
jgi:hypothetical protein